MISYPKENLHLHFDFGRHGTAGDAESLRSCIRRLNPGLVVLESAFTDEQARKPLIAELNGKIDKARKTETGKRLLAEEMFKYAGIFEWPDFSRAVLDIILSERALRVHVVESCPDNDSLGEMWTLPFLLNGPSQAVKALFEGDAGRALELSLKCFREINDAILVKRNAQVVEGFGRLPAEIPELHPSLASGPLSVVARYGVAHAGILDHLRESGFDVSVGEIPDLDHSSELAVNYSMKPSMHFTAEDARRILFDYAYGMAFSEISADTSEDAHESRAVLRSLGGGEGFISAALAISRESSSLEDFTGRLAALFREKKDLYSRGAPVMADVTMR
ncbi:MAG TPA: hypothetical protein VLD37_06560 [Candidatus Bilamarchaeum sp.]|nr:hypothetical protein [Candidatus Bilamarchaeum sp.]